MQADFSLLSAGKICLKQPRFLVKGTVNLLLLASQNLFQDTWNLLLRVEVQLLALPSAILQMVSWLFPVYFILGGCVEVSGPGTEPVLQATSSSCDNDRSLTHAFPRELLALPS